jgi:hypothetical protein
MLTAGASPVISSKSRYGFRRHGRVALTSIRPLVIAVFLIGATMVYSATPAHALPQCGSYAGHIGAGHSMAPSVPIDGSWALVTVRDASVCTSFQGPSNYSLGWVAVAGNNANTFTQAGFYIGYALGTHHFAAYSSIAGGYHEFDQSSVYINPGQLYYYVNNYAPDCHCIQMKVGGTEIVRTPFNPHGIWPAPYIAEVSTETHYRETDIPGSRTGVTNFNDIEFENDATSGFYASTFSNMTSGDFNYCGQTGCRHPWSLDGFAPGSNGLQTQAYVNLECPLNGNCG